jgi:hypothetical protein
MPTESLILRRVLPVPVTFADLRRAGNAECACALGITPRSWAFARHRKWPVTERVFTKWHAALKEVTGAVDEVYAVIDGREVRVGTVGRDYLISSTGFGYRGIERDLAILSIKADEDGYWQNPHEIVHVLSERPVSFAAVERAVNVGWCAKGGAT